MVVDMDTSVSFEEIVALARPVVDGIIYSSVATVSADGEPRSRIVHPVWNWDAPVGWITVRPTSLMLRHLRRNPVITCSYWSSAHNAVYLDGMARPAREEELASVWNAVGSVTGPTAFDPITIFPDGPVPGTFCAVIVVPHRIRVVEAVRLASGGPYDLWTDRRGNAADRLG